MKDPENIPANKPKKIYRKPTLKTLGAPNRNQNAEAPGWLQKCAPDNGGDPWQHGPGTASQQCRNRNKH